MTASDRPLARSRGERPGLRSAGAIFLAAEPHAGLPSLRSSSRATVRSSKGILRPPSNSCPCSCPLPAMTTPCPPGAGAGRGPAGDRGRGGRPRSPARHRPRPAPAATSATIASGSLGRRGLSEGDDGDGSEEAPTPGPFPSAVRFGLVAGRGQPAGAGRRRSVAPRVRRRAARSTFSIESGVWGGSRRGRRSPGPSSIGSKRPGTPRPHRRARRRRSRDSTPSASAAAKGSPARWPRLKCPGMPVLSRTSPSMGRKLKPEWSFRPVNTVEGGRRRRRTRRRFAR